MNPSNILQYFARFQLTACSRGPSATAGLLVDVLRVSDGILFLMCRFEEFPKGKHNIHQRFYQEFNSIVEKFLVSNV